MAPCLSYLTNDLKKNVGPTYFCEIWMRVKVIKTNNTWPCWNKMGIPFTLGVINDQPRPLRFKVAGP